MLVISEHDPQVLYTVRVTLASKGLFDDRGLTLLYFEDPTLDRVRNLRNAVERMKSMKIGYAQ